MGNIPSGLLTFDATVRTYLGDNGKAERQYAAPVAFRCFKETKRRLVRNATTGDERVASGTAWCRRDAAGGSAAFTPGSLIVVSGAESFELIDCLDRNGGGLATPDHLELILS